MATERELKYSTADDHVPSTLELELALEASGLSVAPGRVSRHVDVYHDNEGQLAAAGMALRVRRSSAGSRVTLKGGAAVAGGTNGAMHRRSELELDTADATATWPEPVLAALPPGLSVEALAPVAELRIRRVAFLISATTGPGANAEPFAELAFDEVTCVAPAASGELVPNATAQFHEVEIEWLGADDTTDSTVLAALTTVAETVGSIINLTASPVPKLDRARALLAALDYH